MVNVTVVPWPAARVTRRNPRSLRTGCAMLATGSCKHSWTTWSPATRPVFCTSTLTSMRPPRRFILVELSRGALMVKVV